MKIAVVSLDQVWEDKNENQIKCSEYIAKASSIGVEFIAFPEMTLTGFSMNIGSIAEDPDLSQTVQFFRKEAQKNAITVGFGVVFTHNNKATNNLIIIDKSGNVISSYSKIHPFSFSGENEYYIGGDKLCICNIDNAVIGLTVCYDLRFPEIFQSLSNKCNILLTIANWPEKRVKHWNILLQARAIENQSFMVGVNRIGTDHNNLSYVKSSVVFDPLGEEVPVELSYKNMDVLDLPLSQVESVRNSFPIKPDRKIDLYKSIL
jgi:omega-amidase